MIQTEIVFLSLEKEVCRQLLPLVLVLTDAIRDSALFSIPLSSALGFCPHGHRIFQCYICTFLLWYMVFCSLTGMGVIGVSLKGWHLICWGCEF